LKPPRFKFLPFNPSPNNKEKFHSFSPHQTRHQYSSIENLIVIVHFIYVFLIEKKVYIKKYIKWKKSQISISKIKE